jgi:hypothetical protein
MRICLLGKPGGKRLLGRRVYNIKMDLRGV